MWPRTTNSKGKLFAVFMLVFFSWVSLSAQEMIGGKPVRTGVWEGREVEYLGGEIAVILKGGVSQAEVLPLLRSHGATIRHDFDELGLGLIELPDTVDVLSLAAELKRNPMIEAAEPNMVIRAHFDPNDPMIRFEPNDPYYQDGHQWALKNTGQSPPGGTSDADIDAPEAWRITTGSSSIIIAILDSGIPMVSGNLSHPDLNDADKFILGPDYIDVPADGVRDGLGHGTHVAGIASAETNNGAGIAGVAGNCRVMVIQVFNSSGGGSWNAFYNGVKYAVDNSAEVINFSGGGLSPSPAGELAVKYADSLGVILVASSGNSNSDIEWPAAYSTSYSNVIAVGATQYDDLRASYSNYGSQLNVVAPGGAHDSGYPVDAGDIYSTMPNYTVTFNGYPYYVSQNYGYLPGTSMAAPHVSGLAALLLSKDSGLSPSQVRFIIEATADDKGAPDRDNYYGWGRINAYAALLPLSVYISGPEELEYMEWGTYTANVSGGYGSIHYDWYRRNSGSGVWYFIGNDKYQDEQMTVATGFHLKVVVTRGDEEDQDQMYVDCVGGKRIADIPEPVPEEYGLQQNHPNPFNPNTTIRYSLPEASSVSLTIYDIMGREVRSWVLQESAGYRQVVWDGKDHSGRLAPAGIYITRIVAASAESDERFTTSRKMVLMK